MENRETANYESPIDEKSLYNTTTIALFNLGVEHEYLHELEDAITVYTECASVAKKSSIQVLMQTAEEARRKVEKRFTE